MEAETAIRQVEIAAPRPLPYRWGMFQGTVLVAIGPLMSVAAFLSLLNRFDRSSQYLVYWLVAGSLFVPLGIGLLTKRKWALPLVYVVLALALLNTIVKFPISLTHPAETDYQHSVTTDAMDALVWLLSAIYYRKRRAQFR